MAPLHADAEGELPKPWEAHISPHGLYYHNTETLETTWERPKPRVPRAAASGASRFAQWREDQRLPLPDAEGGPLQLEEAFREFCVRLLPNGCFGRWSRPGQEGLVWRVGESETVGLLLCAVLGSAATVYDPQQVVPGEAAAGSAATGLRPGERLTALQTVLEAFVARFKSNDCSASAAACLVAPNAHLLRRYVAQRAELDVGTAPSEQSWPPAERRQLNELAQYLRGFGLLFPLSCKLTGLGNFRSEALYAEHLLGSEHAKYREHLQQVLELFSDEPGLLLEWLPGKRSRYRNLLQWRDHMVQLLPTRDGGVVRFNHHAGMGTLDPERAWAAHGKAPPPLAANGREGSSRRDGCWSTAEEPTQPLQGSVEEWLEAVQRSHRVSHRPPPPDQSVMPQHWLVCEHEGMKYYHNQMTKESTWAIPPLVDFETWTTHPLTRPRETPSSSYQLYHRAAPRPTRGPP